MRLRKILKFINSNDILLIFLITIVHFGTIIFTFHNIIFQAWLSQGSKHISHLDLWFDCLSYSIFTTLLISYFCFNKMHFLKIKHVKYMIYLIFIFLMLILIYIINAAFRIILVFDGDWNKFLTILINLIKNYTFLNIYLVLSSWLFYSQIKLLLKNYLGETEIISQLASDEKIYFIALKLGQEYVIEPESINFVIADGNYMNLHLDEGIFPIRITLEQLARKLNTSSFYRINRSTIINACFIKKLDDKQENVLLKNNQVYPISKSRRKLLKENLNTANLINTDESHSI